MLINLCALGRTFDLGHAPLLTCLLSQLMRWSTQVEWEVELLHPHRKWVVVGLSVPFSVVQAIVPVVGRNFLLEEQDGAVCSSPLKCML